MQSFLHKGLAAIAVAVRAGFRYHPREVAL